MYTKFPTTAVGEQHGTEEQLKSPPNQRLSQPKSALVLRMTREIVAIVRRVLRFPQYKLIGFRSGVIVAD